VTANPLVVGPVDTSTAFGGAMLLDSLSQLSASLESGDWVASGLAGVGVALDAVATAVDPLGSLIAAGLGWLMEHLEPLKGWLNDLTGDAGAVLGFAGTWDNVASAMTGAGDELHRIVTADLEAMSGASIVAYGAYANGLADRVRAAGTSASSMASALRTCSTVVQVVHDLVRDTLAQLVGSIISWVSTLVITAGLATPYVASQVATRMSSIATRVGRSVIDVISTGKSLKNLLEAMKDALAQLASGVRGRLPGGNVPSAPGGSVARATPTHPSGLPISEGTTWRTYHEQMLDPHVHSSNTSVVEHDYDPFGGMPREEFSEYYHSTPNTRGEPDWKWPPHDGAVPGTVQVRDVRPGETLSLDRIGGGDGAYFSPLDTPFGQRALPPDRLNFERNGFPVDTSNPLLTSGRVRLESSEIAGWFGQEGGGVQYRFVRTVMGEDGVPTSVPMSQNQLIKAGIIPDPKR
jgi:hypothetical protein